MEKKIICEECDVTFTKKKNLYVHLRRIHDKEPLTPKPIGEICDICGQQFVNRSNFIRHQKQMHGIVASKEDNIRKSRIKCPVENCSEHFRFYADLRNHVTSEHKVKMEYNELQFESSSAFHQWKNEIQECNLSLYVLHTSFKLLADGSKKEFYNCHRSYDCIQKGKGVRNTKRQGTNKIGKACPSRIEVLTKSEGLILVKFWMTHVGHSLDIGRVSLSKETKAEIAGKLKEGATFEHVLDNIRDAGSTTEESQRILLLEKKYIDIGCNTKRDHDDAISIKLWVEDMKNLGDECPVLLYKEQGVESDCKILNIKDFALIIMTSYQAQQILHFGHNKICIDGIQGTNDCDVQLYTLMTVDEFGSGSPVAFCFSNRSDELIFNIFFEKVKLKVGIIQASVFMSDDAPAFYNAWSLVMSAVPNRLLCTWHVDRNWRHNLSKISGGAEKKALVYKSLRVLLQSISIESFNECLSHLLVALHADQDTLAFAQYFSDCYAKRPQCWAYCYRLGFGINTDMNLESLHKVLKNVYLDGKKVGRLDKSVNAVMRIARDSLFKQLNKLGKQSLAEKIKSIGESHATSEKIELDMVKRLENENEFLVTSSADKSRQYLVVYLDEKCSDLCSRCHECNICLHTFKCSCVDNVIKLNICKHIHACASFFFNDYDGIFDFNSETDSVKDISETNISCQVQQQQPLQIEDIKRRAELVIHLCDTTSLTDEEHRSILSNFDKIINAMNKTKTIQFEAEKEIDTNEK